MQIIPMIIRYNIKPEYNAGTVTEGIVSGDVVSLTKELELAETFDEMIEQLGENKVYSLALRQYKVDFGNNERAKLQAVNKHSSVKLMTEEEKAEKKSERVKNKALVELLKSKGLTLQDIENM